jgi:hypothetical protein
MTYRLNWQCFYSNKSKTKIQIIKTQIQTPKCPKLVEETLQITITQISEIIKTVINQNSMTMNQVCKDQSTKGKINKTQ